MTEIKPQTQQVGQPIPCHPGCFPAGTLVLVPEGARRIELIRPGDAVTMIGPDGRAARSVVREVFTARNRLVEVRTADGSVVTTAAQPLCLVGGGFRRAGDLQPGERIWHWGDGRRVATMVRQVAATGRDAQVFNLIVGDSAIFVAGGFLARGKPPADAAAEPAAPPASQPLHSERQPHNLAVRATALKMERSLVEPAFIQSTRGGGSGLCASWASVLRTPRL